MKKKKNQFILLVVFCLAMIILLDGSLAFAQEGTPSWRKVWNNIMLFFNFGILVFVFVKYARKPLVDLLKNMCRKIEETLNTTHVQLREAQARLDAETAKIEAIGSHLEEIEKRIIQIAQSEKDFIIAQGKAAADGIIEHAEAYAKYKFAEAQKILSDELAEIALAMAHEKLSRGVSSQDDDRLIDNFIAGLEGSKTHYGMALK